MNKMKKVIVVAIVLAEFATNANAQALSNATASASAKFVPAINIAKVEDLNFGNIITETGGGTVTPDAALIPNRQKTGTNVVLVGGGVKTAKFTVTGDDYFFTAQ
jgi:hypothetical protein